LPEYSKGNNWYIANEIINAILWLFVLVLVADNTLGDYSYAFDVCKIYYLLPIAIFAGIIFRSNASENNIINTFWSTATFLHAMAILPQLMLFTKKVFFL